ncbi:BON domain-containing protein [Paraburkholderia acidiphila]|uniref:BON domain-containing protein n=1 Tax=Paraburkholderia acidiphila TaxID=2571747 RepID=A0A7Z2GCV7_9BURK|nr:BON domain-containing protein [Paraburkholderia acidiphila]QGZ59475.1 BON domain-containing protein [Paraburkholderia acidiphila]
MTIRHSVRLAAALLFAVCASVHAQGGNAASSASSSASAATAAPVAAASAPTDKQLAASVRQALRAARKQGLKSTYIRVRARDGVVTLSGVVANESQIALATSVAQGVSGVRNVTSKIEVRSSAGAPMGNQ